jgi:hypothetical protein
MNQEDHQDAFVPRGSVAFFVVMIAFYMVLWMVFYLILLGRH